MNELDTKIYSKLLKAIEPTLVEGTGSVCLPLNLALVLDNQQPAQGGRVVTVGIKEELKTPLIKYLTSGKVDFSTSPCIRTINKENRFKEIKTVNKLKHNLDGLYGNYLELSLNYICFEYEDKFVFINYNHHGFDRLLRRLSCWFDISDLLEEWSGNVIIILKDALSEGEVDFFKALVIHNAVSKDDNIVVNDGYMVIDPIDFNYLDCREYPELNYLDLASLISLAKHVHRSSKLIIPYVAVRHLITQLGCGGWLYGWDTKYSSESGEHFRALERQAKIFKQSLSASGLHTHTLEFQLKHTNKLLTLRNGTQELKPKLKTSVLLKTAL